VWKRTNEDKEIELNWKKREPTRKPTRHGPNAFYREMTVYALLYDQTDMTYLFSECVLAMSSIQFFEFFRLSSWSIRSELKKDPSCVMGSFLTQMGLQWPILSFLLQSSIFWCSVPIKDMHYNKDLKILEYIQAKTQKTENLNLHRFELHRPSSKGTKLLLLVIKLAASSIKDIQRTWQ